MKSFVLFAIVASAACRVLDDIPRLSVFDDKSEVTEASVACSVRLGQDTATPQPLFIRPGTDQFFHPSDRRGILEFAANQEIELFCTSVFSSPAGISENSIRIACVGGTEFRYNSLLYNFNEFTCRNWPQYVPHRRITTTRCFNQGTIVDTGFHVGDRFLRVFTSCHDPRTEENYYTQYQLTPAADGQESNVNRPSWGQGDFFPGKTVDQLHTRVTQHETIATIVGSTALADEYVLPAPSDVFLARGHMAAMTDFITANEQRSTFLFTNTAPQWQTFNALNWLSVEMSSRRLASDRNITLDTYTGTFGIMQLRDSNNVKHQIFLDFPSRQIPVPQLYYKILINNADQSGIVLIGVNNPHLSQEEIDRDYVICKDVSESISYVNWQRTNLRRGYGYACDVNDFLRVVPHIQGLVVRSLLI